MMYVVSWYINLWEYEFFLIVFSNKPINRSDLNQTRPICLVRFLFWKRVKTEPTKNLLVQTFFWLKTGPNRTVTPLLTTCIRDAYGYSSASVAWYICAILVNKYDICTRPISLWVSALGYSKKFINDYLYLWAQAPLNLHLYQLSNE